MADVLSQSQIDALINAAFKEDSIIAEKKDPEEEKEEYRRYDFRSPRKYSKEQLKMLNGVFDSYSRILATRIQGLLHATVEVNVEDLDEQRYYEFSNALMDGQVVTLAYLRLGETREETPVVICATPNVMVSMFDRLLGGNGDVEDDLPSDYAYTDMDFSLYKYLMTDFITAMGNSWGGHADLKFEFGRIEPNPTLVNLVGVEETVVLSSINISFANCVGRLDVCMPEAVLSSIFGEIDRRSLAARRQLPDHSDLIYWHLQDSDLEITAELGRATVRLRDIYELNVGDVIDMNVRQGSAVSLMVGGSRWFSGLMGQHEKHMAVKIQDVYHTEAAEEGDEQEDE